MNRICELLAIKYPIIQAPMNWISGADLVAAVSNAGGLGVLGPNAGARTITKDIQETGERLRRQIRKVNALTQKPYAVNTPIAFGEVRKYFERCYQVVLEEKVPIVISSLGDPKVYMKGFKKAGIKVLHVVSTATQAVKAEKAGVDAIVCSGYEGGGHKGLDELTTFTLIPMVADAVKVPIIAGGGIVDARGVVAALALGADGVYIGTRFMACRESDAHPNIKESVVRAGEICTVTLHHDKMLSRNLKNSYTQRYHDLIASGASPQEFSDYHNQHTLYHAQISGDTNNCEIMCGQGAGLITSVLSASEIVQIIMKELSSTLNKCKIKLSVTEGRENDF